jgi:hypothetical protein
MNNLARAAIVAALIALLSACASGPKPLPECRGKAVPINAPETPPETRP